MDIGVVRDLIISIAGILILILMITTAIMGFLLYLEVKALSNSIKGTVTAAKDMGADLKKAFTNSQDLIHIFKEDSGNSNDKP